MPNSNEPAPTPTVTANTTSTPKTTTSTSLASRIEDLEETMLLVLAASGYYRPEVVQQIGHGIESDLIRRATLEQVEFLKGKSEEELEALKSAVKLKEAEVKALEHRRDEIGHGLI